MPDESGIPLYMARDGFGPAPEVTELRESGGLAKVPVTLGGGEAWLVTRYADVRTVLSDPATFSNDLRKAGDPKATAHLSPEEQQRMRKGQLLAFDPPEHSQLRRILTPEFTMR